MLDEDTTEEAVTPEPVPPKPVEVGCYVCGDTREPVDGLCAGCGTC